MDLQKIGFFISELRKEKRYTQNELGNQLKISGKAVSKWERGICAPDISLLNDLSDILGVTTTELLTGKRIESNISKEHANKIAISTIKFYNGIFKRKYFRITFGVFIVVLLLMFAFFTTFTFTNFNKCSVYVINSNESSFEIEGIIALNQMKRRIIINKVNYMDPNMGTDQEDYTENIELFLVSNDKNILVKGIPMNNQPISEALEKININIEEELENDEYRIREKDFSNLKLIIKFIDKNHKEKKYEVGLLVNKEFSNDKLVY